MKNQVCSGLSDEHLIREYLAGDDDCFGILYTRYYEKVYSRCYSFSRNHDDAFDMTQDVLLKAMSSADSFSGLSKFSTWLYAVTNNYCITRTSRNNKWFHENISAAQDIPDREPDEEDFEERLKRENIESSLETCLMMLPEPERHMLVLKYQRHYSIKDLQKAFALSASAVKMRLSRARLKMGQIIMLRSAA